MITNEFVIQYGYPCKNEENAEWHWEDEHQQGKYTFDNGDTTGAEFALAAAEAYAAYCDYLESRDEPDFRMGHRVVHRISSDEVLTK